MHILQVIEGTDNVWVRSCAMLAFLNLWHYIVNLLVTRFLDSSMKGEIIEQTLLTVEVASMLTILMEERSMETLFMCL